MGSSTTVLLENQTLQIKAAGDGAITIHDKRTGLTWRQVLPQFEGGRPEGGNIIGGPMPLIPVKPERFPKITQVEKRGDELVLQAQWQVPLIFRWSLQGEDQVSLAIETTQFDETLNNDISLTYPPPFYADSGANFIALPSDEGVLYATDQTDPNTDHQRFGNKRIGMQLSMPWWGVTDLTRGVQCVAKTPFYAAVQIRWCETIDGTRILPTLNWLPARGEWGSARKLSFHFIERGGYVEMAKRFRAQLIREGQFVTLAEKERTVPSLAKMKGAMDMWLFMRRPLTVKDVEKIHALGYDRNLLLQIFTSDKPKPEAAFTPEAIEKARAYGYLTGQYHLYSWVYTRQINEGDGLAEQRAVRKEDQSINFAGGIWGDHLICCPAKLGEVLSDKARVDHAYGNDAFFTDCTTAGEWPMECFDPDHPLTVGQAVEALDGALATAARQNMVVGSEKGFWWAAKGCHFFEGMETLVNYFGTFCGPTQPLHHSGPYRSELKGYKQYLIDINYGAWNRVPLFQLVYHDSIYCLRRWDDHQSRAPEAWRQSDLINLCYGTQPIVCFHYEVGPHILDDSYDEYHDRYLRTYHELGAWHEQIAGQEMVDHHFLTEDRKVQQTTFANGQSIIVNFGASAWSDGKGHSVPPMDYLTYAD